MASKESIYIQPGYDSQGREIPDDTPVAMPLGFDRPEDISETIRRLVQNELSAQADERGDETFLEANDFDVEDEDVWVSPYELQPMQEEVPIDQGLPADDDGQGQGSADGGSAPVSGNNGTSEQHMPVNNPPAGQGTGQGSVRESSPPGK